MEAVLDIVCGGFLVGGQLLPYVPQYQSIVANESSEGFSLQVSLILVVANTVRIMFWIGHPFGYILLVQSFVMILAQMFMIHVCLDYKEEKKGKTIWTGFLTNFWQWDDFMSYQITMGVLWVASMVLTFLVLESEFIVEGLGFIALGIEACLGLPQMVKNMSRRSTAGLSTYMILGWTGGDLAKTWYFLQKGEPLQFVMCGVAQIVIDLVILAQIQIYGKHLGNLRTSHKPHKLDRKNNKSVVI